MSSPVTRILAKVVEDGGALYLQYGPQRIALDGITDAERSRLRRVPANLMVDVDVEREGDSFRVRRVGHVQPAWDMVAVRAVADGRLHDAREAFAELGDSVDDNAALL